MQHPASKTLQSHSVARSGERGWGALSALALLVLMVLFGLVIYTAYRHTGGQISVDGKEEIKKTVSSVRDASENAVTTSKVKTALALSRSISAFDIDVDSDEGVVTLNGEVPSDQTKRLAESIARETTGVRDVRNNLRVNPAAQPIPAEQRGQVGDPELRTGIEERLRASRIDPQKVAVAVQEKVVTLSGQVNSADEKSAAEKIAWGFESVRDVRNNLTVANEASAQRGVGSRDDLAKKVEFELYSSRAFDLARLQIESSEGVVTLNGPVRSVAERELAERIASDVEGVKSVRNNLTIAATTGLLPHAE